MINIVVCFFGISPNKQKTYGIEKEPNQIRYGSNMVANFYKPKYRKTEKTDRNPD